MSAEVESLAKKCVKVGVRFEAEILTTNDVSFTAELDEDGEVRVLGHEICPNLPGEKPGTIIREAVEKVVRTAAERIDSPDLSDPLHREGIE